jgi:hypothetical protein
MCLNCDRIEQVSRRLLRLWISSRSRIRAERSNGSEPCLQPALRRLVDLSNALERAEVDLECPQLPPVRASLRLFFCSEKGMSNV